MNKFGALARALSTTILLLATATAALAQDKPSLPAPGGPRPGLNQEAIDNLSHKHADYYGALAPQNLTKQRPKATFDFTGTWFIDLRRSFNDFKFGPPYPEFLEAGQQAMKEAAEA